MNFHYLVLQCGDVYNSIIISFFFFQFVVMTACQVYYFPQVCIFFLSHFYQCIPLFTLFWLVLSPLFGKVWIRQVCLLSSTYDGTLKNLPGLKGKLCITNFLHLNCFQHWNNSIKNESIYFNNTAPQLQVTLFTPSFSFPKVSVRNEGPPSFIILTSWET